MVELAALPDHAHSFGFWTVNGEIVYSKVQSIMLAQQKNTHDIRYHYWDHVFSSYDWKAEPIQSLPELYKNRAQQLRDSYDHLVILYSGGSDSSNTLKTFLKNNIKVDEVAYWYNSYDEYNNPTNLEIIHAGSEMLHKCRDQYGITITKIDERPYYNNINLKNHEWVMHAEPSLISAQLSRSRIIYDNPQWNALTDSGLRVGIVMGLEKPRIFMDNDHWTSAFLDVLFCYNYEEFHYKQPPVTIEPFYSSPNYPLIPIKQCHVIKNYINLTYDSGFIKENFNNTAAFNRELYFKIVRNLVYPYWNDNTYTIGKGANVLNAKHSCIWNSNTDFSQKYFSGLHWLNEAVDSYFLNSGSALEGLKGCWSRGYALDD